MIEDDATVLIVPAGKGAVDQAILFEYYHCQNRRSFRPFQYVAFYSQNEIACYARVNDEPIHDVVMSERPELHALADHTRKNNGDPSEPHSLYRLTGVTRLDPPIVNDKVGANGQRAPFTQNQRYTTWGKLRVAKRTSDLE